MKEKKAGSAGQILGSMRGPEHWVLISSGFIGDTWGQGGWVSALAPRPHPRIQAVPHHEAILAAVPAVEQAIAGLEEEEAALTVEVVGGDAKDAQALAFPQQLLLSRVDAMVGSGLWTQHCMLAGNSLLSVHGPVVTSGPSPCSRSQFWRSLWGPPPPHHSPPYQKHSL